MSDLTVITVVENDCGLLDLMIKSVRKFTDPEPRFIICDNGRNGDVLNKYRDDPKITLFANSPKLSGGSNRHGDGLNAAFAFVETARFAIIESDCIVLSEDWDYIGFPTYKLTAAKKGELAGHPFYHVCFMVGSTRLLKHNGTVDFCPGRDSNRSNRPYKVHEDVGWQLRLKVRPDQVNPLRFIDCKSGEGKYFDSSFQSDEFWRGGEPVVAHFGRGSNLGGKAIRKGFKHPKEQLVEWKKIAQRLVDEG